MDRCVSKKKNGQIRDCIGLTQILIWLANIYRNILLWHSIRKLICHINYNIYCPLVRIYWFLSSSIMFLQLKTITLVLALNILFPVIAIVGTRTAFGDAKTRSNSMGFICATLNIIMYGSPLSAIVSLSIFFSSNYILINYTRLLQTNDNSIRHLYVSKKKT